MVIESENTRKGSRKSENRGLEGIRYLPGHDIRMGAMELTCRLVSHDYSDSLRLLYCFIECLLSMGEKDSQRVSWESHYTAGRSLKWI